MKKRFLPLLLALLLLATPLNASAATGKNARQNWYFKTNEGGQPTLLGGSTLPMQYGVLALGNPEDKVIYLTFDAGYENGNVATILDALKKHNAPGAFFILPGIIKYNPEIVRRMVDEGHTVGNHTTSHKDVSGISTAEALRAELSGVEEQFKALTGKDMAKYFRPPEGSFSEQTLALSSELGYRTVFWSYAYADWDNASQSDPQKAKQKLLDNLHPGEVLLLHPTSATNAAIMDDLLTEIEKRGYRFGTLDELTMDVSARESMRVQEYQAQGLVFSENPDAGKYIALTFDDGPHATQTDEILAVLDRFQVKATFFPIGENIELYPEVTKRVCEAGHEIGNHTYTHAHVSKLSEEALRKEIEDTAALIKAQCGVTPVLFRPPGGDISDSAVKLVNEMGYRYVLWSWKLDTRDWAAVSVDSVVNTVLKNVGDGNIVLFHDYVVGKSPTAKALEILIPALLEQGYRFVTVSQLANL